MMTKIADTKWTVGWKVSMHRELPIKVSVSSADLANDVLRYITTHPDCCNCQGSSIERCELFDTELDALGEAYWRAGKERDHAQVFVDAVASRTTQIFKAMSEGKVPQELYA